MKLWSGRFESETDKAADAFNSSLRFDRALFEYDIQGSIAHVRMLQKQEIIDSQDASVCVDALESLRDEVLSGVYTIGTQYEDIHMAVESILTERIGDAAKRIHTARSRNDQVALDMRMYVKAKIHQLSALTSELIDSLKELALNNLDTVMPGYTHLQKAQPITFAHHLCAYIEMFRRDISRLQDTYKRTDRMPLGSGALACSTFEIDREYTAELLDFSEVTQNSLDSVSDRDYLLELLSALSVIMMHLSRFCEEVILWSTEEFGYITLSDAFSTGSSMMPQKKNPDMAELIRGKTGRVYGSLFGLLTVMKGLPLAYNKDMQEDKECVFDAVDTVGACLSIFRKMIATVHVNDDKMLASAVNSFVNATDMAEYLVKKGCPFRDAHFIVGGLVKICVIRGIYLADLTIDELQSASELFGEDIYHVLDVKTSIKAKKMTGSPNPKVVKAYLDSLE
ncbi:MAG: argininosuccinate lyase [Anaerofustis sp.]